MANKKIKEYRKVYNRKILRNSIKKDLGCNKIRGLWKKLRWEK